MAFTPALPITNPTWEKIKFDGSLEVAVDVMYKLRPLIADGKFAYARLHEGFDGAGDAFHRIELMPIDGTPERSLDPDLWCLISNTGVVRFLMENEYIAEFQQDQVQE